MKKWIAVPALDVLASNLPLAAPAHGWSVGNEGCTPGCWKNHPEDWQRFTPDTTLGEFFTFPADLSHFADDTLPEARLRAYSQPGNVQRMVNEALASLDEATIDRTASYLDKRNNVGCPL